jgi:hypothetical protein
VLAIFANAFGGEATLSEVEHVVRASVPRPVYKDPPSDDSSRDLAIDTRPRVSGRGTLRGDSREQENRETLAAAFLLHAGAEPAAVKAFPANILQAARDLRVRHCLDLAEASCRMNPNIHAIPQERGELIRAAFGPSTYSLPSALGLAGEKLMSEAYSSTPVSWRTWTGRKPVSSFRTHTGIRPFLSGGGLEQVNPGGELQHASAGEETYAIKVNTFGRLFSIDRTDLVNDNLGAVTELFAELGRQGPRRISDLLYTALLDNTGNFFSSGNGNYADGAGTALTVSSLGDAVALLRKQKDGGGKPIGLAPAVLLVPPELETTGASIINSTTMQRDEAVDMQSTGNPWAGRLSLEIEPRLSDTSFHGSALTTSWYVMAPPVTPVAMIAYLNGRETPVVEQLNAPVNQLGVTLRAYLDFGVGLTDHRAGVMMKGGA